MEQAPEFFSEYLYLTPRHTRPSDCVNELLYNSYDLDEFVCHYSMGKHTVFLYGRQNLIISMSVLFPEGTMLGDILSGLEMTDSELVGGRYWRWDFEGGYIYTTHRDMFGVVRVATLRG